MIFKVYYNIQYVFWYSSSSLLPLNFWTFFHYTNGTCVKWQKSNMQTVCRIESKQIYAHDINDIHLVANFNVNENDYLQMYLLKRGYVCVLHSSIENYSTQFGKFVALFPQLKWAEACTAVWGREKMNVLISYQIWNDLLDLKSIYSVTISRDLQCSTFVVLSLYSPFIRIHWDSHSFSSFSTDQTWIQLLYGILCR